MAKFEEPLDDTQEEEVITRSQIKREMHALQELGARLVKLKPAQWQQFDFSQPMLEALEESTRIKSHNAMRRHTRRLAKLMSAEGAERVEHFLRRQEEKEMQDNQHFHRLEHWRERLLGEGDSALKDLLDACPNLDRQRIRQLIRAGKKERESQKHPAAQRKLFQYIKDLGIK